MLGLVRQHGLTEAAELLNDLLQAKIVARKKAEDAIDEGGKVTLRAGSSWHSKSSLRSLRISIADNGHGIHQAALPQIFDPFFTTKGSIGDGLGLWVSKQVIEKHAASIRVHSCTSESNRGTTISLLVPAASVWT